MTYLDSQTALCVCLAADIPVILWGDPGQGKTTVNVAIAAAQKWHHECLILSLRDPSDLGGMPVVIDGELVLAPPPYARRIVAAGERGQASLLDLDELSTAPAMTQAAGLRVVLERVAGDVHLPNMRVVASANPPEQNGGFDLEAPMANRFCHLDWKLDAKTFREGMTYGWTAPEVPIPDLTVLDRETAHGKFLVAEFIHSKQELLTVLPKSDAERGRAWPSPRSWEMAAKLWGAAQACGANETVVNLLITGTVGLGAGREFLNYVANLDLPNPEALLADPASLVVPPRTDLAETIGASVLSAVLANNTPERWNACGLILAGLASGGKADIAVSLGIRWTKNRPPGATHVKELTAKLAPILRLLEPQLFGGVPE